MSDTGERAGAPRCITLVCQVLQQIGKVSDLPTGLEKREQGSPTSAWNFPISVWNQPLGMIESA